MATLAKIHQQMARQLPGIDDGIISIARSIYNMAGQFFFDVDFSGAVATFAFDTARHLGIFIHRSGDVRGVMIVAGDTFGSE